MLPAVVRPGAAGPRPEGWGGGGGGRGRPPAWGPGGGAQLWSGRPPPPQPGLGCGGGGPYRPPWSDGGDHWLGGGWLLDHFVEGPVASEGSAGRGTSAFWPSE
ncbi:hypothetical protein GCM10010387_52200 [Streptomyces inusitatus]|uniref:Uncharacterized protein n=1 Tax=Streptomyces inusitatus TaxID=68221 RepID=A0A918V124_9ACTN|nr:hypothetical protein GCM10010387_52200 [Streptomyces inusitatus]